MLITILLLLAGLIFLGGMAFGLALAESGMRRRERSLARQRRELSARIRAMS